MISRQKTIIIAVAVVFVVALGTGFWYWQKNSGSVTETGNGIQTISTTELSSAEVKEYLGAEIIDQIQNPLKGKLPPTNPFEKAETNPLEDIYKNPF